MLGREHVHPYALDGHLHHAPTHGAIIPRDIARGPAGTAGRGSYGAGVAVGRGFAVGLAEPTGDAPGP